MKLQLTSLLLFLSFSFSAVSQNFVWANGIGAGFDDIGNDIDTDSSGNTILVGSYTGSITIDTITLSTATINSTSSFIAKFDQAGDVVWATDFAESTSTFNQGAIAVNVDESTGDIYVVGNYYASFSLAGTSIPYVSFGTDIYLAKFNSQGVAQWARGFTGPNNDGASDVVYDPLSNSVYVAGVSVDSITINGVGIAASNTGFLPTFQFLTKYSSSGQFKWVKDFQTPTTGSFGFVEKAGGLAVLSNGDLIYGGYFSTSINLVTQTLTSSGPFDSEGYLSRWDSLGNLIWAQEIGGTGQDFVRDVAVDQNNNIWITGNVDGTATLDTFTFSGTNSGVFVARLDSAGNANYAYANGISGSNLANGVGVDALGNAYFIGRYFNSITFGSITLTGLTTFSTKLYIAKFNAATSSWEWAIGPNYAVGSSSIEEARAIAVDEEDGVLVTGSFFGAMNLGSSTLISSGGSQDIFLTKVGDCSGLSANFTSLGSTVLCTGGSVVLQGDTGSNYEYQWLFNSAALPGQINDNYTANQSGTYTLVVDSLGCLDTAASVTVTINASPTVTLSPFGSYCENAAPVVLTGGLPLGGTYSGPGVSGGVFNPSATGPGTFPIFYTFTNAAGCQDSEFAFVSVTASPFIFMQTQPSVCVDVPPFALTSGIPVGGVYSGLGVSGGIIFNPASAGVGTHTIFYTRTSGLCSNTDSVTITVKPLPIVNLNPLPNVCISTILTPLVGGTPSGGIYSGSGVSNPFFFPSAVGVGQHQVTYTVTQSGCSASDTKSITVDPIPNPIMAQLPVLCENDLDLNLLPYAFPVGGVFSGPSVVDSIFSPSIFGVGSDFIVYTISNACGSDTAVRPITVQGSPTVSLASFSDVCINDGVQSLSGGTPIGGTFSGAGVSGGTFDPLVAGVGAQIITYSFTNSNGCTDSASTMVTVNAAPVVSLSAFTNVCVDAGSQTLTGGLPAGGTYFGTGVSAGVFDPAAAGVGTFPIGYAFADSNSCADTALQSITVIPLPTASLAAFADVCFDAGTQTLSGGLPLGGTYFGTAVSAGVFNPATAGVGTFQIGYAFADVNGCADTAFQNIVVNPLPTVSLSAFADVCIDAGTQTLSGGLPAGGTYFGTAVTAGIFDPSTAGSGTFQIGYAFVDAIGCADTAYENIVVNPLPIVTLSAFADVCIDAGTQILSGGSPSGGTYFGTAVTAGIFDPATTGVGTFQIGYAYTDGNSCADTAYQNIAVNPLPMVSLASFSPVCLNAGLQTLTGGFPVGGTYFGTAVSAGVFNPATAGAGTFQIGYAFADVNGCADTAYQNIVVNPLPTVSLSTFSDICNDAGVQTLAGGIPAGGTYFGTAVTSGIFDPTTSGAGTFQIGYAFADAIGCADTAFQNIVVNPLPIVTLSAFADVCIDAGTQILSGGSTSGGTYFGTAVTAGIFDPATTGVGTFQIGYAYTDGNSCADTAFQNIVVNPLPTVSLASLSPVCLNAGLQILTGGLPVGGTYFGTAVSAGVFNPATAGVGTFQIGYAFADVNGCADTAYQNIVVNPLPTVSLSTFSDICIDAGVQILAGGLPAGGTYFGTAVTAGIFDPATAGAGTFQIGYAFADANGCADTVFQNIVVNPLPSVSFSISDTVCLNVADLSLTSGIPVGGTYSGTGISGNVFSPIAAGAGLHIIGYAFTDANGCSAQAEDSIFVRPESQVILPSISDVCEDAAAFQLPTPSPLGGVFNSTGVLIGADSFDVLSSGVGSFEVSYTFTDLNGCVSINITPFDVNALPIVSFNLSTDSICEFTPVALTGEAPLGGVFSGFGVLNDTLFTADLEFNQEITYTFTDTNGCVNAAIDQLWVYPDPGIQFSEEPLQLCAGEVVSLDFANPIGGDFISDFVSNGVLTAPDTAYNGLGGIYSFGNVCGFDQDTFFLSVSATPSLELGSDTLICEGSSLVLDAQTHDSYLWSDSSVEATFTLFADDLLSGGSSTVWVTVFDALGCNASDTITVSAGVQPAFSLGDDIVACVDSVIELSAENTYDSFVWNTGQAGQSIIAHDGSEISAGRYDFWVRGENEGGCNYTDSISIDLDSCVIPIVPPVDTIALEDGLLIYPNPSPGNVFVRWAPWSTNPILEINIYNMVGGIVRNLRYESLDGELNEVVTENLANGVYVFAVSTASESATVRVIIQR